MNNTQIHIRYAKSLYDLAKENGLSDKVEQDMQLLHDVSTESAELRNILRSPIVKPHVKSKVLKGLFESHFQVISIKFLDLLVRKGRELFVCEIAKQYVKMSRESRGIIDVDLQSVSPIDNGIVETISKKIFNLTGKKPEFRKTLNPSLIGGFTVAFDNNMLDMSIRGRLNKISQSFSDNIYKKGF